MSFYNAVDLKQGRKQGRKFFTGIQKTRFQISSDVLNFVQKNALRKLFIQ